MPNLRSLTLIGLASAAAAIASPTFAQAPRIDRPNVYAVVVRRDTIWFCARAYPNDHHTAFGFVRASRSWLDGRRSARCEPAPKMPDYDDTLFRAGRGVVIRFVRPRLKADPGARQRAYLVVHDFARRRRTVL